MPRIAKISMHGDVMPCKTRLTEREGIDLLKGKSVLITGQHRLKGGALRKDQEFVNLYLPKALIDHCRRQGDNWVVKVKFQDPDVDPAVLDYLDESKNIEGGSFFRKLWRGIKKAGRFIGKVAKKVGPQLLGAVQPVLRSVVQDGIGSVPGLSGVLESGKQLVGAIPGGDRLVSAVEGGVGQVLGSGLSKSKAERRANAVLKLLKPILVQSYMEGGRIQAV